MKKNLALLLIMVMLFSVMTACSGDKTDNSAANNATESVAATNTDPDNATGPSQSDSGETTVPTDAANKETAGGSVDPVPDIDIEGELVFYEDGIGLAYYGVEEYNGLLYYCMNVWNENGKNIFPMAAYMSVNGIYVDGMMFPDPLYEGNDDVIGIEIDPTLMKAIGIECIEQIVVDIMLYDMDNAEIFTFGTLTINTGDTAAGTPNTDATVMVDRSELTVSCLNTVANDPYGNYYIILRMENNSDYALSIATESFRLNGKDFEAEVSVDVKANSVMYTYVYIADFDLMFADIDSIDSATMTFSANYDWTADVDDTELIACSDPVTVNFH